MSNNGLKVATFNFFTVGRIDCWMQHSIFNLLYLKIWVLKTAFNFQFVCVEQWFDSCNIQFFTVLMCEPSLLHLNFVAPCRRFEWLALIFNMRKWARKVRRKMHAPLCTPRCSHIASQFPISATAFSSSCLLEIVCQLTTLV